jgi:hypothetical protein
MQPCSGSARTTKQCDLFLSIKFRRKPDRQNRQATEAPTAIAAGLFRGKALFQF